MAQQQKTPMLNMLILIMNQKLNIIIVCQILSSMKNTEQVNWPVFGHQILFKKDVWNKDSSVTNLNSCSLSFNKKAFECQHHSVLNSFAWKLKIKVKLLNFFTFHAVSHLQLHFSLHSSRSKSPRLSIQEFIRFLYTALYWYEGFKTHYWSHGCNQLPFEFAFCCCYYLCSECYCMSYISFDCL